MNDHTPVPDPERPGPSDPGLVRVSDEERHQVADRLRDATAEGRLDLDELDERLEATYAARTRADLASVLADLPASPAPGGASAPVPAAPVQVGERQLALLGGLSRRGQWQVPTHLQVVVVMGGADLDLRAATFATSEVTLSITAVMGSANVVVGPDTDVVVDGTGIMGSFCGPSGLVRAAAGAPVRRVRVTGVAVWGGVSVERKQARPES